jgi:hypothetical protein
MSLPKVFSIIKVDSKDDRFISLKKLIINELQRKVECDDYETIANYIFEIITNPNLTPQSFDEECNEVFQDDTKYYQQFIIKHAQEIYKCDNEDKDLLDEFWEERQNKNKEKENVYSKYPNQGIKHNIHNKRGGKNYGSRDDREFNLGGKKVVLKKKHDESKDDTRGPRERTRSRDEDTRDEYPSYRNTGFTVPRGLIRGNFMRYPRPNMRGGMMGEHTMPHQSIE